MKFLIRKLVTAVTAFVIKLKGRQYLFGHNCGLHEFNLNIIATFYGGHMCSLVVSSWDTLLTKVDCQFKFYDLSM